MFWSVSLSGAIDRVGPGALEPTNTLMISLPERWVSVA